MTSKRAFVWTGSSAGVDFYRCSDPDWSAEVLVDALKTVAGQLVPRRPAQYRVTVKQRLGDGAWAEHKFAYRPDSDPEHMRVPNRVLTRLVRVHLEKEEDL